jgi:hypothetical protein
MILLEKWRKPSVTAAWQEDVLLGGGINPRLRADSDAPTDRAIEAAKYARTL